MKRIPLYIVFLLALVPALFGGALYYPFKLLAFAPFLAAVYTRKELLFSLWVSAGCGALIDLSTCSHRFGFFALVYALTTLLIHSQRRHFFDDKPLSLALFTALFSVVLTLLQCTLLYFFEKGASYSWHWVGTDLFIMPCMDALYAFLWFTCPIRLYYHVKKVGWRSLFSLSRELSS